MGAERKDRKKKGKKYKQGEWGQEEKKIAKRTDGRPKRDSKQTSKSLGGHIRNAAEK